MHLLGNSSYIKTTELHWLVQRMGWFWKKDDLKMNYLKQTKWSLMNESQKILKLFAILNYFWVTCLSNVNQICDAEDWLVFIWDVVNIKIHQ